MCRWTSPSSYSSHPLFVPRQVAHLSAPSPLRCLTSLTLRREGKGEREKSKGPLVGTGTEVAVVYATLTCLDQISFSF